MANLYGTIMGMLRNTFPANLPMASFSHGRVRAFVETVPLAAQANGDTIEVARIPKGAIVLGHIFIASATLGGTATVALGIPGTPAKYRAAAIFTTVDTPVLIGLANNVAGAPLAAEEIHIITVGAAALPGSGTLRVITLYTLD